MKTRRTDWPSCLAAYIAQSRRTPFEWGQHDCCQFSRKGIIAITDEDPAKAWGIPAYSTAKEALKVLSAHGGVAALPARAGFALITPKRARRGDLAMAIFSRREALGIVQGERVAFAGIDGLVFIAVGECTAAWRVG